METDTTEGIAVHEFFSGIGGMRLAIPVKVRRCVAYDTSLIANEVYEHNFKGEKACAKLVEQLRVKDVDDGSELWTMSPPCQPFTTTLGAHRRDVKDNRTKGFKHLMGLLDKMTKPPRWIVLENVKGFLGSDALRLWAACLSRRGYTFIQFLISPSQCGIPNQRTRLYLLCERSTRFSGFGPGVVIADPELCVSAEEEDKDKKGVLEGGKTENTDGGPRSGRAERKMPVAPLEQYLHSSLSAAEKAEYPQGLVLPRKLLAKPWMAGMSLVSPANCTTFCFTASYGKTFHKSSGSLLLDQRGGGSGSVEGWDLAANKPLERHARKLTPGQLLALHGSIRLFSPKELLNLFGFPPGFAFPLGLPHRNCYHAVGNSLNVAVVRILMKKLLDPLWVPRHSPDYYPRAADIVSEIARKSWQQQHEKQRKAQAASKLASGRRRGIAMAVVILVSLRFALKSA